jgi:5-methylcytosine-specific restriction endonuclease McrA
MKAGICQYQPCSKSFTGYSSKRYCSNTCRTYASHGKTITPGCKERARINNPPKSAIWIKECPIKKVLFIARRNDTIFHHSCTAMDMYYHYRVPVLKNTLTCTECEQQFQSFLTPSHCKICRLKESRRAIRSARRAKIRGVKKEVVYPYKVFTRDQWTCQCCGITTPKKLRGTLEPNAPEMDHIIPLAKGGDHSYGNCQCLCRKCNGEKQEKIEFKYIKRLLTIPNRVVNTCRVGVKSL